ncbi:hypothetical protein [Vibrio barjaei]|uniref:hypothetical protein n=1 Tax=Vibrio barjaei TaxID=1676683 RepID=UPI0022837F29|nr:hypothetical protein [Vibrio barjaei]MCY9874532.1 hypothetical protein [Vibrio barjaei]
MNNKHIIKTYTSSHEEGFIEKQNNHFKVKILWEVDFDASIISYLTNKNFAHNAELLKRGKGELFVEVPFSKFEDKEHLVAYAEGAALVYLVEKTGLNVFGIEDGVKVQKIQLKVKPSQKLMFELLKRDEQFVQKLSRTADATLLGASDYMAAYFYGSEIEKAQDFEWVKPVLSGDETPDFYNAVRSVSVKRLLEIRTPIGVLHMTYRTVKEYLDMPLHKELIEQKGQQFTRPYESAVERVVSAKTIVSDDNAHLDRLKNKMGPGARSMFCKTPPTFVDLKLQEGNSEPHYIIVGYRALYSQETLDRLVEGGYFVMGS